MLAKKVIYDMAKLAALCYECKDSVEKDYKTRCCALTAVPFFIDNSNTDCQLITGMYRENFSKEIQITRQLVVFRGTESFQDVLTDLNAFKEPLKLPGFNADQRCPEVHEGFLNQFLSVESRLTPLVKGSACSSVIFAGHSLGGALATIAAVYYSFICPDKEVYCVTFGSPRVGDSYFTDIFNKNVVKSYRFVNDNDPVPCVPSRWRFKHVEGLCWLHQDELKREIKAWRFWRFFKNSVLDLFGTGLGYNACDDHKCANYIEDVREVYCAGMDMDMDMDMNMDDSEIKDASHQ
jgi:hypothetical protein